MRDFLGSQRFLVVYSAVVTLVFAITVLGGFAPSRNASFKAITAERVNIVEPDGTLRMVIADKALFPGIILKGAEHPHPNRHTAGMLFFNDEGTENGGLTFGGSKGKNGEVSSNGHLSFDQYEQDQVLTLDQNQQGGTRRSAMTLVDEPDYPIGELIAVTDRVKDRPAEEKRAAIADFMAKNGQPHQRLYIGRGEDRSVSVKLKDAEGRDRIVFEVGADGTPAIRLLDQDGKVIGAMPAERERR